MCGKTARTVRREGSPAQPDFPTPIENAGLHRLAAVAMKMRNSTVWRRWLRKCGTPPSGDGGYTDEVYPRVEDEVKCHIASMQALDEDGEPNFNDAD